jgi:hypothetical protein
MDGRPSIPEIDSEHMPAMGATEIHDTIVGAGIRLNRFVVNPELLSLDSALGHLAWHHVSRPAMQQRNVRRQVGIPPPLVL